MRKYAWPKYPRVELRDTQIFILFEDGSVQYWGNEDDPNEREHIINDIQEGLRAIKYLYNMLTESFDSACSVLSEKGFSNDLIGQYQRDALLQLMNKNQITKSVRVDHKESQEC